MALGIPQQGRSLRVLLSVGCVVVLIAAFQFAADLLVPVLVAFFLTQLSVPVMRWLRSRGLPLWGAVALTVLADILVITGVVMICVNLLMDFRPRVVSYVGALRDMATEWGAYLEVRGLGNAEQMFTGIFDPQAETVVKFVNQNILGRVAAVFSTGFFVLVLTVFMLFEAGGMGGRMAVIRRLRGPNFERLEQVSAGIQKYLGIKTLVSAATGTLAGCLTWALGLDAPVLWGMVAFILNFIPAIGSIIAAIPPILIALVQFYDPDSAAWLWRPLAVLGGYVGINVALGNFVEPMLLGQRFGISTLVVLLSVLFWGWLWGAVGMFLAVPLTMLVKVVLDHSPEYRWLSVALGKGASPGELEGGEAARLRLDDEYDAEYAGDVVPGIRDAAAGEGGGAKV